MATTFWLRAETKKNEFRRALVPQDCKKLMEYGHKVVVEDWANSIIPISEYQAVGCVVAAENSWRQAEQDAVIVGLKALPDEVDKFVHRHIFFAHVYKEQDGWIEIMSKFKLGGGEIIDLEFMLDENNRRVCAFGYWAGYVGAALGVLFSKAQHRETVIQKLNQKSFFKEQKQLIEFVKSHISGAGGEALVTGCRGRSGSGAMDCLQELDWSATGWDREETSAGGPFDEILNFDLFVNCVLSMEKLPPFVTKDQFDKKPFRLNMISDVSCDPDSECNMIPLYDKATVLSDPVYQVRDNLGLVAIDNLPSILPRESSFDFSAQLVGHLLDDLNSLPVQKAQAKFQQVLNSLV